MAYRATLDCSNFASGAEKINSSLANMGIKTNSASANLGSLGTLLGSLASPMTLVAGGATAVGAALASSVSVAGNFQQSMANVNSVLGGNAATFQKLSDTAREAGASTQFSASQAADALYFMASAGFSAEQASAALGDVLNLAAAGNMDLARASDMTTSALAQYGLKAVDAGRVTNVMAAAAAMSNSDVGQMGDALNKVGAFANSFGMSVESTAADLGVFANGGLKGAEAGTMLRGVLSSLATESKTGAGALKELGLSYADVNPQTHSFAETMQLLQERGMTATQALQIFGRENVAGATYAAAHAKELDGLEKSITGTNKAAEMAAIQNSTYEGSMKEMSSAIEEAQIALGTALLPALTDTVKLFTQGVTAATDFGKAVSGAVGLVVNDNTDAAILNFFGYEGNANRTASQPAALDMGKMVGDTYADGVVQALDAKSGKIADQTGDALGGEVALKAARDAADKTAKEFTDRFGSQYEAGMTHMVDGTYRSWDAITDQLAGDTGSDTKINNAFDYLGKQLELGVTRTNQRLNDYVLKSQGTIIGQLSNQSFYDPLKAFELMTGMPAPEKGTAAYFRILGNESQAQFVEMKAELEKETNSAFKELKIDTPTLNFKMGLGSQMDPVVQEYAKDFSDGFKNISWESLPGMVATAGNLKTWAKNNLLPFEADSFGATVDQQMADYKDRLAKGVGDIDAFMKQSFSDIGTKATGAFKDNFFSDTGTNSDKSTFIGLEVELKALKEDFPAQFKAIGGDAALALITGIEDGTVPLDQAAANLGKMFGETFKTNVMGGIELLTKSLADVINDPDLLAKSIKDPARFYTGTIMPALEQMKKEGDAALATGQINADDLYQHYVSQLIKIYGLVPEYIDKITYQFATKQISWQQYTGEMEAYNNTITKTTASTNGFTTSTNGATSSAATFSSGLGDLEKKSASQKMSFDQWSTSVETLAGKYPGLQQKVAELDAEYKTHQITEDKYKTTLEQLANSSLPAVTKGTMDYVSSTDQISNSNNTATTSVDTLRSSLGSLLSTLESFTGGSLNLGNLGSYFGTSETPNTITGHVATTSAASALDPYKALGLGNYFGTGATSPSGTNTRSTSAYSVPLVSARTTSGITQAVPVVVSNDTLPCMMTNTASNPVTVTTTASNGIISNPYDAVHMNYAGSPWLKDYGTTPQDFVKITGATGQLVSPAKGSGFTYTETGQAPIDYLAPEQNTLGSVDQQALLNYYNSLNLSLKPTGSLANTKQASYFGTGSNAIVPPVVNQQINDTKSQLIDLGNGIYKLTNPIPDACVQSEYYSGLKKIENTMFKEQSIIFTDKLTPAQRQAYESSANLATKMKDVGLCVSDTTGYSQNLMTVLDKTDTSFVGSTADYNALGLSVGKTALPLGNMNTGVVTLGASSDSAESKVTSLGNSVAKSGVQIGTLQKNVEQLGYVAQAGSYSLKQAVNTWNGIISPQVQALANQIQAGNPVITQDLIDKAYEQADEYGQLTLGTGAVINSLVRMTAENGKFCEAISDFGLAQENTIGIFQQSFIGKTSDYAAFKELDAALAAKSPENVANGGQGGDYVSQSYASDFANDHTGEISAQKQSAIGVAGATHQAGILNLAGVHLDGVFTKIGASQTQTGLNVNANMVGGATRIEQSGQSLSNSVTTSTARSEVVYGDINASNLANATVINQGNQASANTIGANNQVSSAEINASNGASWTNINGGTTATYDGINTTISSTFDSVCNNIRGASDYFGSTIAASAGGVYTSGSGNNGGTYQFPTRADGSWGGTSISGGGSWIGTYGTMGGMNGGTYYGSTYGNGNVSWGGAAASAGLPGNYGSVQWATGGIVDHPTWGVYGEAGREAMVPLYDKAAGWDILRQILPEFGITQFSNGGIVGASNAQATPQVIQVNVTIEQDGEVVVKLDQAAVGRAVVKYIASEKKRSRVE